MPEFKRIVILESPYAGNVERNLRYLRAGMRDAFLRGELPLASHALYTQPGVLDDTVPKERELGIAAGFKLAEVLHFAAQFLHPCHALPTARVFLNDYGVSRGMNAGLLHARDIGQPIETRSPCLWVNGEPHAINWEEEK